MSRMILYIVWLVAYGVCGALGLIQPDNGVQAGAMTACSVLFFVPPGILLTQAIRHKDFRTMNQIRLISSLCLSLTLICLIANIAVFNASEAVGNAMYVLLNFLSVPMVCSRYYALGLFLWSCLLFATFPKVIWSKEDRAEMEKSQKGKGKSKKR